MAQILRHSTHMPLRETNDRIPYYALFQSPRSRQKIQYSSRRNESHRIRSKSMNETDPQEAAILLTSTIAALVIGREMEKLPACQIPIYLGALQYTANHLISRLPESKAQQAIATREWLKNKVTEHEQKDNAENN